MLKSFISIFLVAIVGIFCITLLTSCNGFYQNLQPPTSQRNPPNNDCAGNQFEQGLVSFHFDDGRRSMFENAIPLLQKAGIKSDQYIISCALNQQLNDPDLKDCKTPQSSYVTASEVLQMRDAGHVIGGHTRTHRQLTDFTQETNPDLQRLTREINGGRKDLQQLTGKSISTFAYPRGEGWDDKTVLDAVADAKFIAARSTQQGFNCRNTIPLQLRRQPGDTGENFETMKGWIDESIRDHKWLILVFHKVAVCNPNELCKTNPKKAYQIEPKLLEQVIQYAAQKSGDDLRIITTEEGIKLMNSPIT